MESNNKQSGLKINSCLDCSQHQVMPDPDPYDWFCDDDVKVVCLKYQKNITVACRPYQIRKECNVPNWCHLNRKGEIS